MTRVERADDLLIQGRLFQNPGGSIGTNAKKEGRAPTERLVLPTFRLAPRGRRCTQKARKKAAPHTLTLKGKGLRIFMAVALAS